ncbi:MAG TPA: S-methyl-5'-thioadenosine phosphorylase [Pyrinomonadaceae bacterium]|nr:S-methyl-5'-thioadenosine phosphorylase [Pyrinomonadaceae bacterium]
MSELPKVRFGMIGGSGLYQMPELTNVEEVRVKTPFGDPSDAFVVGTLEGERVAFLPRHGVGHRYTPTEVPFRANIYALKLLGVEQILSASAVGSLQEQYAPLDMVIPDQFFDRTRGRVRESTFFGEGIVAHVSFAHPVCAALGDVLEESCRVADVKVHRGGTYLCMEGPAFSTVAESNVYRSWGMDIIGMTNLQEAKLAREAEICYATLALVTDYDCWHPGHDAVSVETVVEYLNNNVRNAQLILREAVKRLQTSRRECKCSSALQHAIFTAPNLWPEATTKKLEAIVKKYAQS